MNRLLKPLGALAPFSLFQGAYHLSRSRRASSLRRGFKACPIMIVTTNKHARRGFSSPFRDFQVFLAWGFEPDAAAGTTRKTDDDDDADDNFPVSTGDNPLSGRVTAASRFVGTGHALSAIRL